MADRTELEALNNGQAGFLSLVEPHGFHRRFVKQKEDPIRYLLEIQKTKDRGLKSGVVTDRASANLIKKRPNFCKNLNSVFCHLFSGV